MIVYYAILLWLDTWIIMSSIEKVQKIAQSHLNWHAAYSDWEREKSRTITQSSPRARLSYRRRRA